MTVWGIIVIILLSIAVVALALTLLFFVRKSVYIPDKDKEFIEFTIDMYIQYAEDLKINSPTQHKKIVEQLEKIKTKYFKNNERKTTDSN
jgi:hypothetical protein